MGLLVELQQYNNFDILDESAALTVRLLVAGARSGTAELLRLAATRIGDEQRAVVLHQQVLQLLLALLVDVLLVERDDRLRERLANS